MRVPVPSRARPAWHPEVPLSVVYPTLRAQSLMFGPHTGCDHPLKRAGFGFVNKVGSGGWLTCSHFDRAV
jgi:hypothetical protein